MDPDNGLGNPFRAPNVKDEENDTVIEYVSKYYTNSFGSKLIIEGSDVNHEFSLNVDSPIIDDYGTFVTASDFIDSIRDQDGVKYENGELTHTKTLFLPVGTYKAYMTQHNSNRLVYENNLILSETEKAWEAYAEIKDDKGNNDKIFLKRSIFSGLGTFGGIIIVVGLLKTSMNLSRLMI